ncbi:5-formyltetrahydrofolate cyclo-ligase isoform X2 [Oryzias latipes]
MSALMAAKHALRREMKRRVAALSPDEKRRQSRVLSQKLFAHPKYVSSERVAVFLSMDDEVCTRDIIADLLGRGKSCFIPRYDGGGGSHMDMLRLHSLEDMDGLPLTSWNIPQPPDDDHSREEALSSGGLDLMLMPGLGFDRAGRRLGRGKGFYDAYLKRCSGHPRGKPYTLALAFKEQLCEEIPVDANDVLIDEVLSEEVQ